MQQSHPAVSILMGVHNGATTLRQAIESARAQHFTDWELIVVDDGSTDGTAQLLDHFAHEDSRIVVLRHSKNQGLAVSLNYASQIARAPLVARMDVDDENLPDRLGLQVQFFRNHPEVSILGTAVSLHDEQGREIGFAYRPERHEQLIERIYKENPFVHPTVMMTRALLQELGGYDESLWRAQDYDLWLRAYRRYRFHNLQEVLVKYRVKRRLSLDALISGAFVLARGAYREGQSFPKGLYALRFLAAGALNNLGIREARLR